MKHRINGALAWTPLTNENGNFRVFDDVQVAALNGTLAEPTTKNGPLAIGFGGTLAGELGNTGKHAMKFGPELGFGVTMREHLYEIGSRASTPRNMRNTKCSEKQ